VFLSKSVTYSGVVVSVESVEGFGVLLFIHGELDGVNSEFYLKTSEETFKRVQYLGIGVRVEGVGVIISENPLVVLARE